MSCIVSISDGTTTLRFPHLECFSHGDRPHLVFEGTGHDGVVVKVGDAKALMRREEIAALAALFPVRPKR